MRNIRHTLTLLLLWVSFSTASALPQRTQSFWMRVLKLLGVTAAPANQKGDEDPVTDGDIWLYKVEQKISFVLKQGNFRSPIFMPGGNAVLALSGEKVVRFDLTINGVEVDASAPAELLTLPGIQKLISVDGDAPDQVLVLTDLDNDNCPGVGVLTLTDRTVSPLQHSTKDDQDLVTYLKRSEREYDDGTKLEVRIVSKSRTGTPVSATDAFMQLPRKGWINISQCRPGINCGQPTISSDRKFVLFVGKA